MPVLRFEQTHQCPFPVTTTGVSTALTVCEVGNDPMLAFLTQTGYNDEIVYLALGCCVEYFRQPTPANREVISGMGFNPITKKIWCGSTTSQGNEVFSFDPATGQEVAALDLSADSTLSLPGGFATNGLFFVRASGSNLELRSMGGVKLGQIQFPGRSITAISQSPWSWTFGDRGNNEIVVINPFGAEVATAPAPGSAGGLQAIAYDTVSDMSAHPQVWQPDCTIGDPGTIHHPDTPWNPTPWQFRHRLYVANENDQMIYAGYLTES